MENDLIVDLVAEIRAAAPDLPLERVEAIAVGIRRDWQRGRANIRPTRKGMGGLFWRHTG